MPLPAGGAHVLNAPLGLPAHLVKGLLRVGVAFGDIAGAAGVHHVGQLSAAGFFIGVKHIQHAVSNAGAQVADKQAALALQLLQSGHVAQGQVYHMDVVPDAGAVGGGVVIAVDMELFQLAHGHLSDVGHQVVGDAVGVLADEAAFMGTDGVEVPQQGHVQRGVRFAVVREDALNEQLGGAVGVGGAASGEVLPDRHAGGVTVHGGGGGEHEVLHIVGPHGVQQYQCADQVVGIVLQRLSHAFANSLQTGEVHDGVNVGVLGEQGLRGGGIAQVRLHKGDGLAGDLLHPAHGFLTGVAQVIHHHDVVTGLQQFHAGVAADVTGAAAD